jgi:hypothetical protein
MSWTYCSGHLKPVRYSNREGKHMRKVIFFIIVAIMAVMFLKGAFAIDYRLYHPQEAGSVMSQDVRKFIRDQVVAEQKAKGYVAVDDPSINKMRRLYILKFNSDINTTRVTVEGEEKEYYYSSAIFRDLDNGEQMRVIFYAEIGEDGSMSMVSREIDKVGGKRRR